MTGEEECDEEWNCQRGPPHTLMTLEGSYTQDGLRLVEWFDNGPSINVTIVNVATENSLAVNFSVPGFLLDMAMSLTNNGQPFDVHDMDCAAYLVINTTGCDDPEHDDEHPGECCEDCCHDDEDHCHDCQHNCHDCHGSDDDHNGSDSGSDRRLSNNSQCCDDCWGEDHDCHDNCHDCHGSDDGDCCEDCCYDDEDHCHECQHNCHDCYHDEYEEECDQTVTHETVIFRTETCSVHNDVLKMVAWLGFDVRIDVALKNLSLEKGAAINVSLPKEPFSLNVDVVLTNNDQPVELSDMDGAINISMITAECDDHDDSGDDYGCCEDCCHDDEDHCHDCQDNCHDCHGSDDDHNGSDSGSDRRLSNNSQCCDDCWGEDHDCHDNCHDCHGSDDGDCCEDCCYDDEDHCYDCQHNCHDCHHDDHEEECKQRVVREHILFVTTVMSVRNDRLQMVGAIAPKLLDGTIEADVKNFALEKTALANFSMPNGMAITADMSLKNDGQPVEDADGRLDGECFATVMMFTPEDDEGDHHHDNCCEECCEDDEGDHDVCLETYCHGKCNDDCENHRRLDDHEEGENSIALFRSTACSVRNDVFQMAGAMEGDANIDFDIKNLDTEKGGDVTFALPDFTLNTDIWLTNDGQPVELHDMDCAFNIMTSENGEPSRTVMTAEGSVHNDRFQLVTSLTDAIDDLTVDLISRGNEFSFDVDLLTHQTRIQTDFSIDNNDNDDLPFSEEHFRINMGVTLTEAGEPQFDIGWAALGNFPVEEEDDDGEEEEEEEEEQPIVVEFAAKLEVSNPEAFVEDPGAKAGVIKGMAGMLGIDESYVDAVLSLVDARRLWEAARRLSAKAVQVDYVINPQNKLT